MELNDAEKIFQDILKNRVKNKQIHPLDFHEFEDIMERVPMPLRKQLQDSAPGSLTEDTFFSEGMDIAVFRHLRFMPPHRHQHRFFEMTYVFSGDCVNFTETKTFRLEKGDLFIIAPDTTHALWVKDEDTIVINFLVRSSTFKQHFLSLLPDSLLIYHFFIKPLYGNGNAEIPYLVFKTGNDKEIRDMVLGIYEEYSKSRRYKNTMLTTMLSYFFIVLLRKHEQNIILPNISPLVMNDTTIYLLQYMQNNYSNLKLSQLAKMFNFSERQLQRIILTATGKSFSENIIQLRMENAAELLKISQLSIDSIAQQLGYYDASVFRKAFKKYYGQSPSEYRSSLSDIPESSC